MKTCPHPAISIPRSRKVLPAFAIVYLTGVTSAEAQELASAGDLDAAIAKITGVDTFGDVVKAVGDGVHGQFQRELDAKNRSRKAMEKQYENLMEGIDR